MYIRDPPTAMDAILATIVDGGRAIIEIYKTDKALHMKLGSARPLFMKFEGKVNWDSPVPTILTSDPFRL